LIADNESLRKELNESRILMAKTEQEYIDKIESINAQNHRDREFLKKQNFDTLTENNKANFLKIEKLQAEHKAQADELTR
jgi:hypothetical protein